MNKHQLRELLDRFYVKILLYSFVVQTRKRAKMRLKRIGGGYILSREEKEKIKRFWAPYGIKPKMYWYKLFAHKSGVADPRYIPDDLFYSRIIHKLNNFFFTTACADKGIYDWLFHDIRRPDQVLKCMNGVFYDEGGNVILKEEALNIVQKHESVIIKPSLRSGGGQKICFYDREKQTRGELTRIFDTLYPDFVVQLLLGQHPDLARIHPQSLNTIRTISLMLEGEVFILSSIFRMGSGNARVDNTSSGGFACPVHTDGRLNQWAVNRKSEWVERHPGGVVFAEVVIPSYERMISMVKQCHTRLPHICFIGWDFAISATGEPVLIEYNCTIGSNQISCGPTFGEHTERVLELVLGKK